MHKSSYDLMKYFIARHMPIESTVLDVGGANINGNYQEVITKHKSIYKTLDIDNADYTWNTVPGNVFNVIISGQTLEHDKYFWKTLELIKKIIVPKGIVIIIVPSKGNYHQWPYDCYRFYPDSSIVFANILEADIIEVVWNSSLNATKWLKRPKGIGKYQHDTTWGDLGMVFKLQH